MKQNIFESPAKVIVNAVNTVGVMGKGIAKKYKQLYPEMYKEYRYFCEKDMLDIGKLWLYKDETKWILNFPTKKHWRNPSKIVYIEEGLKKFVATYEERGIHSISFPQLGTGHGGLDWEREVKPLFEKYLKPLPIDIFVHIVEPNSTFEEHENIEETKAWLQAQPKSLSVNFVWEDLIEVLKETELKIKIYGAKIQIELLENDLESEIKILVDNQLIVISKEDLAGMWIKLRDYGYLFKYDFPIKYRENNQEELILYILNLLPYVKPIETYDKNNSHLGISIQKNKLPQVDKEKSGNEQTELLFT